MPRTTGPSRSDDERARKPREPALPDARLLLELSHDATFVWRAETGIELWNDAAAELYGHALEEARGRAPRELLGPHDAGTWAAIDEALRARGRWEGALVRRAKDGTARTVSARLRLVRDAAGVERVLEADRDDTAHARADAAQARSEERLRTFVEHTPAPVAVLDRELRYVLVSRRWLSDFRLERAEILGKRHYDVFPDLPERWKEIHRRCLAGAIERAEEDSFVRADGETDWLRWEVRPWYEVDGAVGGIIVFSELITARKRAEHERDQLLVEVQRRAAELEATIEAVADGLIVCGPDGALTAASTRAKDILGVVNGLFRAPGTVRVEAFRPRTEHGELLAFEDTAIARSLRGETVRDQIVRVTRPGGGDVWLSSSAAPIVIDGRLSGAVVTFADVTDRLAIERTLREREEHFRALAEAMPQLVWVAAADGNATFLNRQWVEFTGSASATAEERRQRIHPDDEQRVRDTWSAAIRDGRDFECEYRFRRVDGAYRWLLTRAHPWRDARGEIQQWFGTATDVHELKALSEALREADARKDDFLAVLSHELRTPLTPIRNSVAVLDRAAPGSAAALAALRVIDRQSEHLHRLIDDLLDVTRITRDKITLRREPLDLGELVRRVTEDYASIFAASGVTLTTRLGDAPLWVDGDATRLAQILGNLLKNAAKFTPSGGHTEVELAPGERDERGETALLRVRDDGAGITGDLLPRLFMPFMQADRTLDRSRGGLGLGLSLVRGLVELHGGAVSAASEGAGHGTLLTVRLPRIAAPAASASAATTAATARTAQTAPPAQTAAPTPTAAPRRRANVLVIEDNEDAAESLREALRYCGHEVEVASDGLVGVQMARTLRPDVVLCDLGLPGLDGYEVARRLKAEPSLEQCLLVALSGYARPEDVRRSLEAGFARHVAKPPDLDALDALVTDAATRR